MCGSGLQLLCSPDDFKNIKKNVRLMLCYSCRRCPKEDTGAAGNSGSRKGEDGLFKRRADLFSG